jgi:hypothetical protein
MLAPPAHPVEEPVRPAIERVVVLLAYEGFAVEADAVLYGICNHALWGDDDLHAAAHAARYSNDDGEGEDGAYLREERGSGAPASWPPRARATRPG